MPLAFDWTDGLPLSPDSASPGPSGADFRFPWWLLHKAVPEELLRDRGDAR